MVLRRADTKSFSGRYDDKTGSVRGAGTVNLVHSGGVRGADVGVFVPPYLWLWLPDGGLMRRQFPRLYPPAEGTTTVPVLSRLSLLAISRPGPLRALLQMGAHLVRSTLRAITPYGNTQPTAPYFRALQPAWIKRREKKNKACQRKYRAAGRRRRRKPDGLE